MIPRSMKKMQSLNCLFLIRKISPVYLAFARFYSSQDGDERMAAWNLFMIFDQGNDGCLTTL